jgi:hypothetical protein
MRRAGSRGATEAELTANNVGKPAGFSALDSRHCNHCEASTDRNVYRRTKGAKAHADLAYNKPSDERGGIQKDE